MIGVMFLVLGVTLIMGIPVAFSVVLSTLAYIILQGTTPGLIIVQKMVSGVSNFTTLALPLFIFSGALMVFGSTSRLMKFAGMLVGRVKGGLGTTSVVGAMMFGAISGSGVATTASIGGVMIPEMIKNGYKPGYSASLLATSSTLGVLIPPSTTFIIYCQITGVSVSKMFLSGILPGIVTGLILIAYNTWIGTIRNYGGVYEKQTFGEVCKIMGSAILPMIMPLIILGGVFSGIFTATEAAAVAVIYAIILTLGVYREVDFRKFIQVTSKSAVSTANILLIIAASTPFGWILTVENIPNKIASLIVASNMSLIAVWAIVLTIMIILGTFMASTPIILLTTPILLPIMVSFGVDPIQYGIVLTIALGIGAITPPLAVTLFVGCEIAKIKIEETFPEVLHLCVCLLLTAIIMILFPQISLWLPSIEG